MLLAVFETRTGKIAAEVKQYSATSFSWSGTAGAGSGGSLRDIKERVV